MKLICAPMATISHKAFRSVVDSFGGCDEYYGEMIHAPSLLGHGPFEKYYLLRGPAPDKMVWQLTGNKAAPIIKAASIVSQLGGIGVDLNMGCSAPSIYKTGAGIAWMIKPLSETRALVSGVREALSSCKEDGKHIRLSVKLRLGTENFSEKDFFAFTDMLITEGVTRLTLHPRTIKEKYRLHPRWEYVERLAKRYKSAGVSVALNGDVRDAASLAAAMKAAPTADAVMIGRAAVQKPWIFAELKSALEKKGEQTNKARIDLNKVAIDFIDGLRKYQPREFWKTRMQRFFSYYCDNFSFAHYAKTQILNAQSLEEATERLSDYFYKAPNDRYLIAPFLANGTE